MRFTPAISAVEDDTLRRTQRVLWENAQIGRAETEIASGATIDHDDLEPCFDMLDNSADAPLPVRASKPSTI